jgi:glycosyltransferase involved in cell wall biosynthesis
MTPRISVVTPSYNQGRFIRSTLDSILQQGYPNLEYIVVDGGSTDETLSVLQSYSHHLAYWCSEPDSGQTDALLKGFERATGEILCWVNADDLLEPESLSTVARLFAERSDRKFVWGDAKWIDENNRALYVRREIPFVRWLWLYGYNYIPQPAAFWRHDLYCEVGGLDASFRVAMDTDLFARMSRHVALEHIPIVLASFRTHATQRTNLEGHQMYAESRRILEREIGRTPGTLEWAALHTAAKATRVAWRTLAALRKGFCA